MPILVVVAAGLALVFKPSFAFQWWAVLAFIPALILAFLVRFLLEWTLALSAFWTTRVNAINQVYFTLMLFLAGQIAPLTLFPRWIQVIADILPFRWMLGFPVELSSRSPDPSSGSGRIGCPGRLDYFKSGIDPCGLAGGGAGLLGGGGMNFFRLALRFLSGQLSQRDRLSGELLRPIIPIHP